MYVLCLPRDPRHHRRSTHRTGTWLDVRGDGRCCRAVRVRCRAAMHRAMHGLTCAAERIGSSRDPAAARGRKRACVGAAGLRQSRVRVGPRVPSRLRGPGIPGCRVSRALLSRQARGCGVPRCRASAVRFRPQVQFVALPLAGAWRHRTTLILCTRLLYGFIDNYFHYHLQLHTHSSVRRSTLYARG